MSYWFFVYNVIIQSTFLIIYCLMRTVKLKCDYDQRDDFSVVNLCIWCFCLTVDTVSVYNSGFKMIESVIFFIDI